MKGSPIKFADLFSHPANFFSFGFGSGLAPFAPGTFGTLVAVPVYLLIVQLPLLVYVGLLVLMFAFGVWVCEQTSASMGVHDHSAIVWDEIVGFLIAMIAVPAGWATIVAGFLLFRFFDIVKPWPISWVDKHVGGGFGIMVDDVLAGLMALLVMHLILKFLI